MTTTWMEETENTIREAAEANDWGMVLRSQAATGSRYFEIARYVREADQTDENYADFGGTGLEEFTLRISDHGDCYCSSDYSLAEVPSGDDTTIEAVLARLAIVAK